MNNISKSLVKLSPLQRALLALEKMESKLQALERAKTESIAIIGMGCRFPGGANNLETYWQLLRDGVDAITEVPPERWDMDTYYDPDPEVPGKMYTRWGGFLRQEEVERFDPEFFGIAPREAKGMDPQQRMLLEVGWEALENAAQSIEKLSGSRTGVFVGVCYNDYKELQLQCGDASKIDAYLASGNEHSMLAGRLSYTLGLQGPSMTIDTSCSSSLVAVHLACQNLRNKECNLALAGGVNLILSPYITIGLCKARMLAADGRCKTFDQAADGFVRGEGCGILVLKRLAEAVADGNNILAVIRGSAVNQDGASSGLTAPNESAQEAVIREALFNAGVKPSEVSYVEAHGTGTSLGDPIEVQALAAVLGESREPDSRFMMGSVKTNLGHLESAAGIAGLIKVVLALQYEEIPPHLHFSEPNPYINWRDIPVVIPTERLSWPAGNGRRIAGVSSFGFSGTNAHVVLEEAPISRPVQAEVERPLQLCTLSARSEQALQELAVSYSHHLEANPKESIADLCFTANAGRSHFEYRVAVVAESAQQLHEKLTAFSAGKEAVGLLQGQTKGAKRLKLAFLFTGQGSQYIGMGRELYATQPTFRKALDHCEEILKPYLEQPLTGYLFPHDGEASKLNETWVTQPALFALEYALAQLWQSWGIKPDVVLGHSVGEYVAACIAGVFSLEDGLKLIATRGKLMGALPPNGAMAAVMAPESVVTRKIEPYGDDLSIAAYNGPKLLVISGKREALGRVLKEFDQGRITTQRLTVSHAFHSPLMEPILKEFEGVLKEVQYSEPQIPLVSNVTGEFLTKAQLNADYFLSHIRKPVRFAPSIEFLSERDYQVFLEIGPEPVLLGMARRCVSGDVDRKTKWLPSLRRGKGDWEQILESLGNAYVSGVKVDWLVFDKDYPRRKISLPTYPFQRKRYWIEAEKKARSTRREGLSHPTGNPLLGYRLPSPHPSFECLLSPTESLGFLKDHRVYGEIVVPGAAYLEMGLAAARECFGGCASTLEEVVIQAPLLVEDAAEGKTHDVQVLLSPQDSGEASFEIFSLEAPSAANGEAVWTRHASGKIRNSASEPTQSEPGPVRLKELQERCSERLSVQEYYERLHKLGIEYGPCFQGIASLWQGNGEVLGQIRLAAPLLSESGNYQVHPALLDAGFQLLGASLSTDGEPSAGSGVYMPIGVERLRLYARPGVSLWCHAVLQPGAGNSDHEVLRGDFRLLDESGQVVAVIEGLTAKRASREALQRATQRDVQDWLYEVAWRPQIGEGHPDYLPTPKEISLQLVSQLEELKVQSSLAAYGKVFPELETLSAAYVVRAFQELGWEFPLKERFSTAMLANKLGVVSQHQRLLGRLLEMLSEERILRPVGSEWEVVSEPKLPDPEAQQVNLLKKYPLAKAELTLLGRCGERLSEVLTGECDPLQLLFPKGDLTTATKLYQDSPGAKVMNSLVGKAVIAALKHLPEGRRVRILEIGAGTGGTTSYLLPHLPADRTDYVFTDISPLFTTKAQEKFAYYPFVRTQLLDIEKAPKEQGFGEHQYDLIVAANVLHATRDLRETLGHVQQLLAPGGLLVLLEATAPQRWVDLIFGLLEGWWRFADHELRPSYSLLSASQWQELLESEGFTQAVPIPLEQEREGVSPQAMIVAQRAAVKPEVTETKAWLILADAEGTGEGLAALLREKGEECTLVYPGEGYERLGAHEFRVDPEDFKPLFQELVGPDKPSLYGVVHLWSLDTPAAEFLTSSKLESASQRGCGTTLHLVQSLLKAEFAKPPHLFLVTRGAQAVGEESAVSGVAQSPLWGMGKVIALEYPELSCVRIDLEPEAKGSGTQVLFEEIWSETPEDQVAFRDDVRHVARLVRSDCLSKTPESAEGPIAIQAEKTYMITGGLGGLGLAVARWLVEQGARHLVLVGRGEASAAAREAISALEEAGAQVKVAQADVSKEKELAKVFAELRESMPPLKGVIHSAGVLEDGILLKQSWDRFAKVFAPKVQGAWNLHAMTQDMALDLFVLFSSQASMLGTRGQGNHAAACAFEDGLAHYRKAQGLPALSINWGAWSEIGAAAERGVGERLVHRGAGVGTIAPQQGLQVLARLLRQESVQVGVMPINWSQFIRSVSTGAELPFFSELVRAAKLKAKDERSLQKNVELLRRLEEASLQESSELLLNFVRGEVANILGLSGAELVGPKKRLMDLGLDSMMALELRSRLERGFGVERSLSATLVFDYPTIEAIAGYLAQEVLHLEVIEESPSASHKSSNELGTILAEVERLSEDEVKKGLATGVVR